MLTDIHDCLLKFEKRAERATEVKLTETFVDAAPLLASVSTRDHQVIFGRRGTGKTHILKYLDETAKRNGEFAFYIDLRSVGSNGSIYNEREKSHAQRATPLLLDVLQAFHEVLLNLAVERSTSIDLSIVGPKLDRFADSISEVEVVGSVEKLSETTHSTEAHSGVEFTANCASTELTAHLKLDDTSGRTDAKKESTKKAGVERYYVRFGTVQSALKELLDEIGVGNFWLLLDEWSEIPIDIQPYLADLLRRCVLPLSRVTVKIAAIEHRTNLATKYEGEYVGIELGADAGGDVNLNDFMVFDNDATRAKSFFADLLFKHYRASDSPSLATGPKSPNELVSLLFTQINAFEEFVRAVEGVPRDAVYLSSLVARKAYGKLISVKDVRDSARDWYQRDKSTVLKSNPELGHLLHWIMEEVIGHRRARAFLLKSYQRQQLVETLFDSRLLHILKKSISTHDIPGARFDVYKLDYGCYVDLIGSSRAPSSLLPSDDENVVIEVPPDDYRSIRRAILDLNAFEASKNSLEQIDILPANNGAPF